MSEFTVDQTGSCVHTITSGTFHQPSPIKLSKECITAKGSSENCFGTAQPCSEFEFETVTICPPLTNYKSLQKCECTLSAEMTEEEVVEEILEEFIKEPTPVLQPIKPLPPYTQRISTL